MSKKIQWLHNEINKWLKDGIITENQSERLRTCYPLPPDKAWGKMIFSSMGAVIFGLGVILLIAYNWYEMHRFVKLSLIFLALAAAHGSAFYLGKKSSSFSALKESLHLLGTMLFGAGIWLVAQIYNINAHYPTGFLIWSLGALLLGWTLPSVAQGIIVSVLLTIWTISEGVSFNNYSPVPWIIIVLSLFPLAVSLRSGMLLFSAAGAFLISISQACGGISGTLVMPVLFLCSALFLSLSLLVRDRNLPASFSRVFSLYGNIIYFVFIYILTFPKAIDGLLSVHFDKPLSSQYFMTFFLFAAVPWTILIIRTIKEPVRTKKSRPDYFAVPISLLVVFLRTLSPIHMNNWGSAAVFNGIFLIHCILLISYGCRTIRLRYAVSGCLFLSALLFARYTDLFESLLARSFVFLVMGAFVFTVGIYYSKSKKEKQVLPV
jgi:uncharacterized membrane protein